MREALEGEDKLQLRLREIGERGAARAMDAGMRAALPPLLKALRAAINASGAPTRVKRAARLTLGQRAGKVKANGGGKAQVAKAGFAVGKSTQRKKEASAKRRQKRADKGRRGVGIDSPNIHWFVLGTQPRQSKKGHRTGQLPALLGDVTDQAFAAAKADMIAAARKKIREVLDREASKR